MGTNISLTCPFVITVSLFNFYNQLIGLGIATFLTSGMLNGTNYTKKTSVKRSGTVNRGPNGRGLIKNHPSLHVTTG